jgi:hypothetical protein
MGPDATVESDHADPDRIGSTPSYARSRQPLPISRIGLAGGFEAWAWPSTATRAAQRFRQSESA